MSDREEQWPPLDDFSSSPSPFPLLFPDWPVWRLLRIPDSLLACGHFPASGAPGLVLLRVVHTSHRCEWYGSAVKVLTGGGVDAENREAATTFLQLPRIATASGHTEALSFAADWLARGVSSLTVVAEDGRVVRLIDTLQPAPAAADDFPASHGRTAAFSRAHAGQCGSRSSSLPKAKKVNEASVERLRGADAVSVVLHPTRRPEVKATGKSKGRRYAVLQPRVDYEVRLYGEQAAEWTVEEVQLWWTAAGSKGESDQRRIKRMRL